jgi:hypothetical protein
LKNGIQVEGIGMDPGFHQGDDKAGMTEWGESRLQVDRFGIPRLGARGCSIRGAGMNDLTGKK